MLELSWKSASFGSPAVEQHLRYYNDDLLDKFAEFGINSVRVPIGHLGKAFSAFGFCSVLRWVSRTRRPKQGIPSISIGCSRATIWFWQCALSERSVCNVPVF